MLVRKSVQKANNLVQKTLQRFKSVCFGDYKKLSDKSLFRPFSCNRPRSTDSQTHEFYTNVSRNNESDIIQDASCESSSQNEDHSPVNYKHEDNVKKEKKAKASSLTKRDDKYLNQNAKRGGDELALKMRELVMIDGGDVEHVLDVEEALHYYSRLKSPVYLDIVDNFFMDMYCEFSLPQPSSSINCSRRRHKSLRL